MTCSKELEPAQTQNQPADKTSKRNRQGNETKHKEEEKERGQKKKSKKKKQRRDEEETGKGKKERERKKKRKGERERREREREREKENKEHNTARTPTKGKTHKETRKRIPFLTLRAGNKKVIPEFGVCTRHSLQPSKRKVIHSIRNCKNQGNYLDVNVARTASTEGSSAPTLAKAVQETEILSNNLTNLVLACEFPSTMIFPVLKYKDTLPPKFGFTRIPVTLPLVIWAFVTWGGPYRLAESNNAAASVTCEILVPGFTTLWHSSAAIDALDRKYWAVLAWSNNVSTEGRRLSLSTGSLQWISFSEAHRTLRKGERDLVRSHSSVSSFAHCSASSHFTCTLRRVLSCFSISSAQMEAQNGAESPASFSISWAHVNAQEGGTSVAFIWTLPSGTVFRDASVWMPDIGTVTWVPSWLLLPNIVVPVLGRQKPLIEFCSCTFRSGGRLSPTIRPMSATGELNTGLDPKLETFNR